MGKCIIILVLFSLTVSGCIKRTEEMDVSNILAMIELDSTTLVATTVVDNLEIPWDITFDNTGGLWFTEQKGTVSRLNVENGEIQKLLQINDLNYEKSRGLLGMALHPNLSEVPHVFLFYNFSWVDATEKQQINSRLVRYTWSGKHLHSPKIILDSIPGKRYHNGARLAISNDLKLFVTTGDVGNKMSSQDTTALTGKILRINLDGSIPKDNPIANNATFSYGHRNAQGLVFTDKNHLFSSEHGTNNDDELNFIHAGKNYGWPLVEGMCDNQREEKLCEKYSIIEPLWSWSPTIAPAGLDFYNYETIPEWKNSLMVTSLKAQSLFVLSLNRDRNQVKTEKIYLHKTFGRLRDVAVSPNGEVYLATSNKDWHPEMYSWMYDSLPRNGDLIIKLKRVDADVLEKIEQNIEVKKLAQVSKELLFKKGTIQENMETGNALYNQYCSACHRPNGKGVSGSIPPLSKTDWVTGDSKKLINIVLYGLSEPIEVNGEMYDSEMPGYMNLTDSQISKLLSYIRMSFGNKAGKISEAEIVDVRHNQ